ncbi:MAG: araC 4 [Firmicutes bacterium]|nr:araC 4 [Bacillota bacterium]
MLRRKSMLYRLDTSRMLTVRLMNTAVIQPPYIHNRRRVDEFVVYIIKKGKMFLTENNVRYTLVPGDFLILDPDYIHEGYQTSYCEYFYIHFRHEQIQRVSYSTEQENLMEIIARRNDTLKSDPFSYTTCEDGGLMLPKYYHFANYSDFIQVCCVLEEASNHNADHLENYKLLTACKVLEAFTQTYRSYVLYMTQSMSAGILKSYRKVQLLLSYLNANYADKITSMDIEEKADCNFDYINRVFKQLTHRTIFAYLNMVRINHAKELISTTSMKISEIGQAVGFSDIYYFSKVFKKTTGITPSAFAKGVLK